MISSGNGGGLLSVKEAAFYLDMTRQQISRLIANGTIPIAGTNPLDGRYKLVARRDLDKLRKYRRQQPPIKREIEKAGD